MLNGLLSKGKSIGRTIMTLVRYVALAPIEIWVNRFAAYRFRQNCIILDNQDGRKKGRTVIAMLGNRVLPIDNVVIDLSEEYKEKGSSTAETIALAILKGMIIVTRYPEQFEGVDGIIVWSLEDFYAYCIGFLQHHLENCYRKGIAVPPPPPDDPPPGTGASPHFPGFPGSGGDFPQLPGSGPTNPPFNPNSNRGSSGSGTSNRAAISSSLIAEFEALWVAGIEASETGTSSEPSKSNGLQHFEGSSISDRLPGESANSDPITTPSGTTPEAMDNGLISNHQTDNLPGSNKNDIKNRGIETQNSFSQASIPASRNPRAETGNNSPAILIPSVNEAGIKADTAFVETSNKLDSDSNSINGGNDSNPPQPIPVKQVSGADGNQVITIKAGDGKIIVDQFGGVGKGINPTPEIINAVDTLQFKGAQFTAANMILTQSGNDLIITFEGDLVDQVVLRNFSLENLDNISQQNGASITLVNILFDGDTSPQDSYDVVDADWIENRVLKPNSVTFLNDLDNYVEGFDNANNVINGQGGNDTIITFSGNDILRGGDGNDTLDGGAGINTYWGGSGTDTFVLSPYGLNYVQDFKIGEDRIGLSSGLSVNQVKIEAGTGVNSGSTLIKLISTNDITLAVLTGVQANTLTTDIFLPGFSDDFPPRNS
jgi:Ca2+-binding RTX toxin-like protein